MNDPDGCTEREEEQNLIDLAHDYLSGGETREAEGKAAIARLNEIAKSRLKQMHLAPWRRDHDQPYSARRRRWVMARAVRGIHYLTSNTSVLKDAPKSAAGDLWALIELAFDDVLRLLDQEEQEQPRQ